MDPSDLLRGALLQISDSDLVRSTITTAPVSRSVVTRYVPGEAVEDAVATVAELRSTNRLATIDYLGEDTTDRAQAEATRDTYVRLLDALAEAALAVGWYVSFSGIITFKSWTDEALLRMVPDDRLLVESDAPYLAPVPHRGNATSQHS